MCLLLIAIDSAPGIPLLLIGNRDEFHARATANAQVWADDSHVVGGRDLVASGSWMALRDDGRFAAVTNLRTGIPATAPKSRGWLVRDFVLGGESPDLYLERLRRSASEYGPFNLVVSDRGGVSALGSADGKVRRLESGVHVISNGPIGVHWPKTERLERRFVQLVASMQASGAIDESRLLDLLHDETQPVDSALPVTGVGLAIERRLAPIFIRGDAYGTRASTLLMRTRAGSHVLNERRFGPSASEMGSSRWAIHAGGAFEAVHS